jgi:alanine dehydrogenase
MDIMVQALTNATMPYALKLANYGFAPAMTRWDDLRQGLNVWQGQVTHAAVADAHGLPCAPFPAEHMTAVA